MGPPYPNPTSKWHNDTYPSISPSRPELSASGKTVIVTGAGIGIGRETAAAFATAGAEKLVLIGRSESSLLETRASISNNSGISILVADVSQPKSMQEAAAKIGIWHILVLTAAFTPSSSQFGSKKRELPTAVDTNIKVIASTLNAFKPTADLSGASVVLLTSAPNFVPTSVAGSMSSDMISKLPEAKLIEPFTAENPHIFAASLHPGFVSAASFAQMEADKSSLPVENVKLPAHFIVWLTSPEGKFLRGKSIWANWDVDELKSMADEMQAGPQTTAGVEG